VVKVERHISKRTYLLTAIITAGIFLLGMLLGLVVEGKRVTLMQSMYEQERVNLASSQLQFEYLSQLTSKESCPTIYEVFTKNTVALEDAQERLLNFQKDSTLNTAEFETLKRQYVVEEMRYYLFAKKVKDICGTDIVRLLYFYSDDKNCPDCKEQEFVLNYLKLNLKDKLLIFALDEKFDQEPMISILKSQYNLTRYPAIAIENEGILGFQSQDSLKQVICPKYNETPQICIQ